MTKQQIKSAEDIINKHRDQGGIFDWEFAMIDKNGNLSYLFNGSAGSGFKELKLIKMELIRLEIIKGLDFENIRTRLTAKGLAFKNFTNELKEKQKNSWIKGIQKWLVN